MEVTLQDLQEQIKEDGCTETYQNGERQSGSKMSSAIQAYNSTIKNYSACMKLLALHLPKEEKKAATVLSALMSEKAGT